jgi:hypothetical protein
MSINTFATGVLIALLMLVPASAQRTSNWPSPPSSAESLPGGTKGRNPNLQQMQQLAEQRKAALQKDTERLSQLISQLKLELDNTPAGTLSVNAVKKSKEIEKLAKRVRKEIGGD